MIKSLLFSSKKLLTQPIAGSVSLTLGFIFIFLLVLVGGFALTNTEAPYASELAFIEHSGDENTEGSVIPASCESNPPTDHFVGDCGCSISAISACSGTSCLRTIRWSANVSTVNLFQGSTNIGTRLGSGQAQFAIPPGGSSFSLRRNDGTILCVSSVITGYPAPTLSFTVNGSSNVTVNQAEPVTLRWAVQNAGVCTASGAWSGGKAANNGTHTEVVVPASASNVYTLRCAGPGGSSPTRSVSVTVRPPEVTFEAVPALIGPGMSSTLRWTVSGANFCNASGGWSGPIAATNGNRTVSPSYSPLTSYQLSCTGVGGTTNRTATITMPSGSLSATSCTIPHEAGSCLSTVAWNSANFLGNRSVKQGGVEFSSAVSGPISRPITPDNHSFRLEDTGSAFVRTANPSVACETGSVWVTEAQLCIPLPVLTLNSEKFVRSGTSADLAITVRAIYLTTCTILDGSTHSFTHTASPSERTYNIPSRKLNSAQIVTLTCTHNSYPIVTESRQVRIEVIPTVQEI